MKINRLYHAALSAALLFVAGPQLVLAQPDLIGEISAISIDHHANVSPADVAEGCAGGTTDRSLVRFSMTTHNIGDTDLFIGDPMCPDCDDNPGELCSHPVYDFICSASDGHGHAHLLGFADYRVIDPQTLDTVAVGHKESFCLTDTASTCIDGSTPKFSCANQGLTAGCGDTYRTGLGCQYVDVTGLPPGDYTLFVRVNDQANLDDANLGNNDVEMPFTMTAAPLPDLVPKLALAAVDYNPEIKALTADCPWLASATRLLRYSLSAENQGSYPLLNIDQNFPFAQLSITNAASAGSAIELPFFPACIADSSCEAGVAQIFSCSTQGISSQCEATTANGSACDAIDISELAPGHYNLGAVLNPDGAITEVDVLNNGATESFEVCSGVSRSNFALDLPRGFPPFRNYRIRGRLPRSFGNPRRHGAKIKLFADNVQMSETVIPPASQAGRCRRVDGWKRNRKRNLWNFSAASGFLDDACSIYSQGLRRLQVKRVRRGFRVLIKGRLFANTVGSPKKLELRLDSGKVEAGCLDQVSESITTK